MNMFWEEIQEKFKKYKFGALFISQAETEDPYGKYRLLAGFGSDEIVLNQEIINHQNWLMGGFCYEYQMPLNNFPEPLISFPLSFWFVPDEIIEIPLHQKLPDFPIYTSENQKIEFQTLFPSSNYLQAVHQIKKYIQKGDHYEMNLTRAFQADAEISVFETFIKLIRKSPTPFSALFKWHEQYILCASPERFLQKTNNKLLSQPIKGTIPRGKQGLAEDLRIKNFQEDEKFRSENVMIVDLVRNDLSKVCRPGTVQVEKLFEVQSFKFLHHLVSSISGELKADNNFSDILSALFPAGSMTGAPKLRAMQRIAELEPVGRGVYSGSIGYIHQGNFDFNVVIRSLIYDSLSKKLCFHTGGAITILSDPETEWQESELKAQAIFELFKI